MKHTSWLFFPLATFGCFIPLSIKAQVTPDGTTATTVNQDGNNFAIEQGDRVGDNLFHSFNEFSVPTLGSAVFNNAGDIANIFSRVTGSSISNIDGLLGANGTANLYLINPNGIIFGENASLQLGGSFFASTADSLLFEGDTEFSAVNPQAAPLLEVSIPIGASFRDNPRDIINRSVNNGFGLGVVPENNITFIGGNIVFEGGQLTANSGNVRLGGLSEAGIVGINDDSSLIFPENVAKADINFTDAADVDVRGTGGGNINVNARNLNLEAGELSNSGLVAGVLPSDVVSNNAQAGNIVVDVTENINIDDSVIINQVFLGAVGNAGNIIINASSLQLTNGGVINTNTRSQGNAGLVDINATNNILIRGEDLNSSRSSIASIVDVEAVGIAGNVSINTGTLELIDGGGIGSNLLGEGEGGLVQITASDRIIIDSQNSITNISGINSIVGSQAQGDAGNIDIDTSSLFVLNGGEISANTSGQGNAGNIDIIATDNINIDAGNPNNPSNIGSNVTFSGRGNAGSINIFTNSLSLTNGGGIGSFTVGRGNAGSININAENNIMLDDVNPFNGLRSQLTSTVGTSGQGNAGDITVNTDFLSLANDGSINIGIFGTGEDGTTAEAGNIEVNTNNLSVIEGSQISASTFGNGDSGTIEINTLESVTIEGRSQSELINNDVNRGVRSRIASTVQNGATGEGGDINITTTNLSLSNDGTISAGTLGQGNAGNIVINASESVSVDGINNFGEDLPSTTSTIINTSEAGAIGNAGGINITTANLSLINNGQIDVSSLGDGNGGDIVIQTNRATLNNGQVSATNTPPQAVSNESLRTGGNVNFAIAEDIILTNNSQISAEASENATGGNVTINTDNGFILAFPNQNNDIVADAEDGQGGAIDITTQAIFGLEDRSSDPPNLTNDIDATSEADGLDGTIDINNPAIDPTTGLINLPESVTNASDQISQNPCQQGVGSQFIVTGKGGLPPNPTENLESDRITVDLVEPLSREGKTGRLGKKKTREEDIVTARVPAMGWVFNDKGEVTLTAYSNTDAERERSPQHHTTCQSNIAP